MEEKGPRVNVFPSRERDFKPLYQRKNVSKSLEKPREGQPTKVRVSGRDVDGVVLFYFDDEEGVEHAYVNLGRIAVIRKSEDVV